ncbi:unnamed protein product [Cuscuta campestris]|uniref:RING-CH-type domain-containing protein n=1 Tax=Cuscuta campestris TaxID=132261 RepID=A0A484NG96_9ASTE|nr:unnamed protein product [Cuscuta campestris]
MEAAAEVDEEANGGGGAGNLQYNRRRRRRQRRRRPSLAASSETTTDGSFRFTDSDSDQSWASAAGGPYEECRFSAAAERLRHSRRNAFSVQGWVSDDEIDLESGELELKLVGKEEAEEETRDCRICRLSLSGSGGIGGDGELEPSSGDAIQLGCSCRGDLGTAHKQCAETWFKIRGNTTCEICGETAVNIAGEQTTEENETSGGAALTAPTFIPETQRFWNGRRVMNFLLASMILAFVISWLFHFNILP